MIRIVERTFFFLMFMVLLTTMASAAFYMAPEKREPNTFPAKGIYEEVYSGWDIEQMFFGNFAKFKTVDKTEFNQFIKDAKSLKDINLLWNKFPYEDDDVQFGVNEYFQSPQEFLKNKQGDCDDYALAKFYTLLSKGVNPNNVMIAGVGFIDEDQLSHMIVLYKQDGKIYVLDSLRDSSESAPNDKVILWEETDYKLYFTINMKSYIIYNRY